MKPEVASRINQDFPPDLQKLRVAMVPCADYQPENLSQALRRGLSLLGGLERFAVAGQRVLVKPNLMAAMRPDRAQTTHPLLVRAFGDLLIGAGATVCVGDNPVFGFRRWAYRRSGLAGALAGSQAQMVDLSQSTRVPCPHGKVASSFLLPNNLSTFDRIFSMPKLKAHLLMGLTGAVKNSYGLIHGHGERKALHLRYPDPDDFAQMLLDLGTIVRPGLFVVDAIMAAEEAGPRFGRPKKVGYIVLGEEALAVDYVLAQIIGADPEQIAILRVALQQDVWRRALSQIEIVGTELSRAKCPSFSMPRKPGGLVAHLPGFVRRALIHRSKTRIGRINAAR